GDTSTFLNSTKLIIGPDTNLTTFPESPTATLQASDFIGPDITTVNFANAKLTFSGLKAVDYFGDGSFYLVDTPGEGISCGNFQQYGTDTNLNSEQHLPGHLTALTDVTPNSFIVLGGDTFHHAGQAHPWPQFQMNFPCPAHLLEESKSAIST
ncbi:hypothetical protein B0H14DRAFT_2185519, partial [Mycena olivaceomarginata]